MPLQVIRVSNESQRGLEILGAMEACAPETNDLMLWGIGRAGHSAHRDRAIRQGRRAILWDLGYTKGYFRFSVDHDHPWRLLDKAPTWGRDFPARLREDAGDGHILLIGLGRKSKTYLNTYNWESRKIAELKRRFPGVPIQVRPKPRAGDGSPTIEQAMKGARLVVCRHSNVGVDAAIAGIPLECEDGAAFWLMGKPYTPKVRQEFLDRLAWFQWKTSEAQQAWQFLETL